MPEKLQDLRGCSDADLVDEHHWAALEEALRDEDEDHQFQAEIAWSMRNEGR
jgi:hypothetical protein